MDIYLATQRLSERLFQNFSWPLLNLEKKKPSDWPEPRLMAIVIIGLKLCYGLDDVPRFTRTSGEPAAVKYNWDAWETFLRAGNRSRRGLLGDGRVGTGLEVDVKEADVFDMGPDEMDRYMDWYERTWCDEEVPRNKKGTLCTHSYVGIR